MTVPCAKVIDEPGTVQYGRLLAVVDVSGNARIREYNLALAEEAATMGFDEVLVRALVEPVTPIEWTEADELANQAAAAPLVRAQPIILTALAAMLSGAPLVIMRRFPPRSTTIESRRRSKSKGTSSIF